MPNSSERKGVTVIGTGTQKVAGKMVWLRTEMLSHRVRAERVSYSALLVIQTMGPSTSSRTRLARQSEISSLFGSDIQSAQRKLSHPTSIKSFTGN